MNIDESGSKLDILKDKKNLNSSFKFLEQKEAFTTWRTEDDPVPQWLIEEALKKDIDVIFAYK